MIPCKVNILSPTLNLLALLLSRLPSSRINGNGNGLIDGWMDAAADEAVLTPPTTLTPTSQFTLADGDQ